MSQQRQNDIVNHLFQTHSACTTTLAKRHADSDKGKALRALRALERMGVVFQAQNDWDGEKYEARRRGRGRFVDTLWTINVEPDPNATREQVAEILARVRNGENFNDVACELTESR